MKDDAFKDKRLPMSAVKDTSERYTVKVKNVPDQAIANSVKDILRGDFIAGFVSLLSIVLDAFLGNTAAGESEKKDFYVVFANNSLLRVDYMFYKYEFSSKGLKDEFQNGFCYYSQISALDLKRVSPQIMLYEISRAIGNNDLSKAAGELKAVDVLSTEFYGTIDKLNAVKGDEGYHEE